jgi:aminoglycoside phosphotransferase (APT) family kinase protein
MHEHEVLAGPGLVRRLLASQMPQWADLPLAESPLGGTDNALYRLGDDMVVRLPRIDWAVAAREKEHEWLPRLAPFMPVEIPVPLALGAPGEGYPWPWSVYRWLEGEDPSLRRELDRDALLPDLVRFVEAMRRVDLVDAPRARRGVPLRTNDTATRASIELLACAVDRDAMLAVWERTLRAPDWRGAPVWVHGDLDARNLLVADGRLAAVIDWGGAGVGDPACDVAVAWKVLSPAARAIFRSRLEVDDATWERARGWTLSQAANALSYYTSETNPVLVRESEGWLTTVLADGVE